MKGGEGGCDVSSGQFWDSIMPYPIVKGNWRIIMDTCSLHSYLQPPPSPFIQIHMDTTPTIKVSKYLDTHTNETKLIIKKSFLNQNIS